MAETVQLEIKFRSVYAMSGLSNNLSNIGA